MNSVHKRIYFSIVLFLFDIFTISVNHVLAKSVENILGGYLADQGQFTYQVAIVAKQNEFDSITLIGSGAFIGQNLVLSAAQCFVDNNGELKNYQYSIITDTIHWRFMKGTEAAIDKIYLPKNGNYYFNNIAVAMLHADFNIANYSGLSTVNIPNPNALFYDKLGTVTGYGYLMPPQIYQFPRIERFFRDISGFLTHAQILIMNSTWCLRANEHIDIAKHFCGLMLTEDPEQKWGICENDIGSPIVHENMIVGIAGENDADCDDTDIGHAYTKVSTYASFIKSIIDGSPLPDTLIHRIRRRFNSLIANAARAA